MFAFLDNAKIALMGTVFAAILVVTAVVAIGASAITLRNANQLGETWSSFDSGPARKEAILSDLRDAVGYGGAIHEFKNFVLRRDRERVVKVQGALLEAALAVARYEALATEAEKQHLGVLKRTLSAYSDAAALVEQLAAQGLVATTIDQRITIDDQPALDALKALAEGLVVQVEGSAEAVTSGVAVVRGVVITSALVIGVLLLLTIAGFVWFARVKVARSLGQLGTAMESLAAGNNEVAIPGLGRGDELGGMAAALQVFKDAAVEKVATDAQKEEERKADQAKRKAMEELAQNFDASVGAVVASVSDSTAQMRGAAESMTATADQATQQTSKAAGASEHTSGNVHAVAAATEEMSASIGEISRQVGQSAELAQTAVEESNNVNTEMTALNEAAQKIGDVIELINTIAGQTNLLALNATIEAARAGEAGKGFAVVASEVKSLATQTAKATEDITAHVSSMQDATGAAVKAIADIGTRIDAIAEIASTIAAAVEQQGSATQEIARNVQEAASGTDEVSGSVADASQSASEVGRSAGEVLQAASTLGSQFDELNGQVRAFLKQLLAA